MQPSRLRVVSLAGLLVALSVAVWVTSRPRASSVASDASDGASPSPLTRGGDEPPSERVTLALSPLPAGDASLADPGAPPTPKLDPRPLDEPAATRPSKAGALSPETVKRAFAAAQAGVRGCAPGPQGSRGPLVVDLVIEQRGGRGRLREARAAEGGRSDDALWRCVAAALEAVDYPAEGGDAEIGVQLSFDLSAIGPSPSTR